jgi:hypothetical protein
MERQQGNDIAIFPMALIHLTFANGTKNIGINKLMLIVALFAY